MAVEFFVIDVNDAGDGIDQAAFDTFEDAADNYNKWLAGDPTVESVACVLEKRVTGRGATKYQVIACKGQGQALHEGGWTTEGRDKLSVA